MNTEFTERQALKNGVSFLLDNLVGFSESKCPELVEGQKNMWFVYILLCEDNSLYTGISNNLKKRFSDHKSGKGGKYTRSHKPVRLIYKEKFDTHSEALKKEAEIKSWTRNKKIKILKLKIKNIT